MLNEKADMFTCKIKFKFAKLYYNNKSVAANFLETRIKENYSKSLSIFSNSNQKN